MARRILDGLRPALAGALAAGVAQAADAVRATLKAHAVLPALRARPEGSGDG